MRLPVVADRSLRRWRQVAASAAVLAGLFAACEVATAAPDAREAEAMRVPGTSGRVVRATGASGGRALLLTGSRSVRTRLTTRAAATLSVTVRARSCLGAPRIVAKVRGRTAISRRVAVGTWSAQRARTTVPAGTHTVTIKLANRLRTSRCRRALLVDRVALERPARRPASSPPAAAPGAVWRPAPNTTWQWQLTTPVDQSVVAQMYDIDLFGNAASVVSSLHAQGRKVVCYLSAGSWEPGHPSSGAFPASVLGNALNGLFPTRAAGRASVQLWSVSPEMQGWARGYRRTRDAGGTRRARLTTPKTKAAFPEVGQLR